MFCFFLNNIFPSRTRLRSRSRRRPLPPRNRPAHRRRRRPRPPSRAGSQVSRSQAGRSGIDHRGGERSLSHHLYQSRRPGEVVDPEEIPGCAAAIRWILSIEAASAELGYPLSLWTWDEALRNKLNSAMYVPSATGTVEAPGQLTFEYADGDVTVRKSFRFEPDKYVVHIESSVVRGGNYVTALPAWPAGFGDAGVPGCLCRADHRLLQWREDRAPQARQEGQRDQQRQRPARPLRVFRPGGPVLCRGLSARSPAAGLGGDAAQPDRSFPRTRRNRTRRRKSNCWARPSAIANGVTSARIFVGPKAVDVLKSVRANTLNGQPDGTDLSGMIDWGFFSIIAKPLFVWLKWTHDHWPFPNWGWSIIILTLIINIVLLPLRLYPDEVGAGDAANPAADPGHTGQVQEVPDARPAAGRDEPGDLGAVQGTQGEPGQRMSAAAGADAVPVGLLPNARAGQRAASRDAGTGCTICRRPTICWCCRS